MLNVLLESKAQHNRRVGGTLTSAVVHGAIITAAVLLSVPPTRDVIKADPPPVIPVFPNPPAPPAPPTSRPAAPRQSQAQSPLPTMPIDVIDKLPTTIQTVDPNMQPIQPSSLPVGPAILPAVPGAGPAGLGGPEGGAIDARYVEKPPQLLRSERPHFPEALRARGQGGRIVVQFVVDTL